MQKVRLAYLNIEYLHTQEKGYIYAIATAPVGGRLHAEPARLLHPAPPPPYALPPYALPSCCCCAALRSVCYLPMVAYALS